MLTLTESIELTNAQLIWDTTVTGEVEELAEFYSIDINDETDKVEVTLFDDEGTELCKMIFDDLEIAEVIIEEHFDIQYDELDYDDDDDNSF